MVPPSEKRNIKNFVQNLLIEEGGTVDTPVSARMAKLPAVRRFTAAGPMANALSVIAWRAEVSNNVRIVG